MAFFSSSADTHAHNKIENKHNRYTLRAPVAALPPHLLPCPGTRFTAVPVASATCSLWIFLSRCSSFFHFSGLHASSHNSGLPDTLSFSHFPGKNKGAVFRGVGIKPEAFTHRRLQGYLWRAPPSITTAGRSDKWERIKGTLICRERKTAPTVGSHYYYRCFANA